VLVILASLPNALFGHLCPNPGNSPAVFSDSVLGQLQVAACDGKLRGYPGHLPGTPPDEPALMVIRIVSQEKKIERSPTTLPALAVHIEKLVLEGFH
jgi:hypothetical protein